MSSARILVVDDEADIRTLVKEILTDEGYDVAVAANASEARQLRGSFSPELILLDIWMPDVDGITLLREWMAAGNGSCPIVMMSGHGTVDTAVEATRLGALDFVEKPLSLAKLLRTVERGLESARKLRGAQRLLGALHLTLRVCGCCLRVPSCEQHLLHNIRRDVLHDGEQVLEGADLLLVRQERGKLIPRQAQRRRLRCHHSPRWSAPGSLPPG